MNQPATLRAAAHAVEPQHRPEHDLVTVIQGPAAVTAARNLDAIPIPPGTSASALRWTGLRGRRVHLIEHGETDDARVRETAKALLAAGAVNVLVTRTGLVGKAYVRGYLPKRKGRNA